MTRVQGFVAHQCCLYLRWLDASGGRIRVRASKIGKMRAGVYYFTRMKVFQKWFPVSVLDWRLYGAREGVVCVFNKITRGRGRAGV